MTLFLIVVFGWIFCSLILLLSLWGIYALEGDRQKDIHKRKEDAQKKAIQEFRRELDEHGVALFEIPASEANHDKEEDPDE